MLNESDLIKIVNDFNESYIKKSERNQGFHKKIENFKNNYIIMELINRDFKYIYEGKNKGRYSYIRRVCSENLTGTHVGASFSTYPNFFTNEKKTLFKNFLKVVDENKILKSNKEFKLFFINEIAPFFAKESLKTLKSCLIQILSVYYPSHFLPIYDLKELKRFIIAFEDIIKLDKSEDGIFETKSQEFFNIEFKSLSEEKDLGKILYLYNTLLFIYLEYLKKDVIEIESWNCIEFVHFLFSCIPFKGYLALQNLKLNIIRMNPDEEFIRALFLETYQKLGFKFISKSQTQFPDIEVVDGEGNIKQIEIEYEFSNFFKHKHNLEECDFIVCWSDEDNNKNIEVSDNLKPFEYIELLNEEPNFKFRKVYVYQIDRSDVNKAFKLYKIKKSIKIEKKPNKEGEKSKFKKFKDLGETRVKIIQVMIFSDIIEEDSNLFKLLRS